MIKKVFLLLVSFIMMFAIVACTKDEDKELKEIADKFDLNDPKESWDGNFVDVPFDDISSGSTDVAIYITFKQVKDEVVYPELEARHFGLSNIRAFNYIHQSKPESFPDEQTFRQTVFLFLKNSNAETFTEAIRHLETLSFIKSAIPVGVVNPTGDI